MFTWIELCTAILVMAVFLYAPGALIIYPLRKAILPSLLFSPPITLAVYGIEEILFSILHIHGSWISIVLPPITILIAINLILTSLPFNKKIKPYVLLYLSDSRINWGAVLLYIAVSAVLTAILFLKPIDGMNSYSQLYDNAWHMGIIEKFVTTGDYSTLRSGNIVDTVGSTFYPTGWHSLVALAVSATGYSIPLCINASIVLILVIIFPSSMFACAKQIFSHKNSLVVATAFAVLAFTAFPWRFLTFGPLYSNLLSFSVLPLVIVLALRMVDATTSMSERIITIVVILVSIIGVAVTQPNAVFTMGILVAPYVFVQFPRIFARTSKHTRMIGVTALSVIFLIVIAIVWYGLYHASFMQRTVTWKWPSFETKTQSLYDVLFVGFHFAEPQYILGILVIIGIIYTLIDRTLLWVTCSYLLMCFMYAVSSSTEGYFKQVLTGFWYHDQYRLGASAVLFGILLAGIGITTICATIIRLYQLCAISTHDSIQRTNSKIIATSTVLLLMLGIFFPSHDAAGITHITTPFGAILRDIRFWNASNEPKSYTVAESDFVHKVKKIIPHNALVLNQPFDGSVYAYGADGLNVYYKAWEGNWIGKPSVNNKLISTKLDQLSHNMQVQQAAHELNAHYLIILDRSDYAPDPIDKEGMRSIYASYHIPNWKGIDNITDSTPGFTVLLKQGNMRLYKLQY